MGVAVRLGLIRVTPTGRCGNSEKKTSGRPLKGEGSPWTRIKRTHHVGQRRRQRRRRRRLVVVVRVVVGGGS